MDDREDALEEIVRACALGVDQDFQVYVCQLLALAEAAAPVKNDRTMSGERKVLIIVLKTDQAGYVAHFATEITVAPCADSNLNSVVQFSSLDDSLDSMLPQPLAT
jgi:hypothetical protein